MPLADTTANWWNQKNPEIPVEKIDPAATNLTLQFNDFNQTKYWELKS